VSRVVSEVVNSSKCSLVARSSSLLSVQVVNRKDEKVSKVFPLQTNKKKECFNGKIKVLSL